MPAPAPVPASVSPLRLTLFRSFWIASVVSNIGSHMYNAGAGWQMTLLSSSPFLLGMVALMSNGPVLLLSPLAGAVTDITSRRTLLLITQGSLMTLSAVLALCVWSGWLSPVGLLALVGLLGLANAFNLNCWQTLVQDLVPKAQLAQAVSLGSISVNLARTLGPALGGIVIAAMGTAMVFFLNALSFLGTLIVAWRWREERRQRPAGDSPALLRALREGFCYLLTQRLLALLLIRHLLAVTAGYSVISLLPLLIRERFGLGGREFGFLSACFGAGAMIAALSTHSLARRFGIRRTTRIGMSLSLIVLLGIAFGESPVLLGVLLGVQGFSLTLIALNHNVRVRMASAPEFAGRVYSYYSICATGGVAASGLIFGSLGSLWGVGASIASAAVLALAALGLAVRHPMPPLHDSP